MNIFESSVVRGKIVTDETGICYELPVLLTSSGHVDVILDYLIEHWGIRSPDWMMKVTMSIKLFMEYLSANSLHPDEQAIFQNFRQRLLTGTINFSTCSDATGLWWRSRGPRTATKVLRHLTDFFNWWAKKNPDKRNPADIWRGSRHDLLLAEAAFRYRRNKAFLGHTWSTVLETSNSDGHKSNAIFQALPKSELVDPPSFPEDKIFDLIFNGFKVGGRYSYRDMLITLLLNGAGFRESEPFHLYLWDVTEDPACKGSALVLIHHPAWGEAPFDQNWRDALGTVQKGNRAAYLAERYGLSPRNWLLSTDAAGWKGGMHETQLGGYYKQAYWFIPEFGKIFWTIWNMYVQQVMAIDPALRNHPFAFVNTVRGPVGSAYKIGKFQRAHAAAVRRIGLVPAKHLGTSEHGHRHAYGQRLRKANVPKEMIRRFMHHADLDSQNVYTEASRAECLQYLEKAMGRLDEMTAKLRTDIDRENENIVEKNRKP